MSKTATLLFAFPRIVAAGLLLTLATSVFAQVVPVSPTPQIGSSNPATAEPTVPRPDTTPCSVTLFEDVAFENYTPYTYTYAPPSNCAGPWSKVVFTADFTVSAGRQYDRTASFYLGHANIYYGTTAEPRSALSPSWHVERDVTDLGAIFKTSQSGQADLGNFVGVYNGVTYNGIIYVTAKLVFYPASWYEPAPVTPDVVVPINGSGGDAGTLNTSTDQISETVTLPQNVERLYLDVVAQSQSGDEFWYTCVPTNLAGELQSCGNTAYRQTEIWIDGKAAGLAPVSAWIYTGGIDPYLWEPITGVQTLDFKPYRVDLTPFAALLDDGKPHVVAVSVYNANSYFLATANLLAYEDHGSSHVTGELVTNTLIDPGYAVTDNISNPSSGVYTGTVETTAASVYLIAGYVNTSHGRIKTSVDTAMNFVNAQTFNINASQYVQDIKQASDVHTITTVGDGPLASSVVQDFHFPLTLNISSVTNPDGSGSQTTQSFQTYDLAKTYQLEGVTIGNSLSEEQVHSQDTLSFNSSGALTGATGSSNAFDVESDSLGHCYYREVKSANRKVTEVNDHSSCPSH